MPEKCQGGRHTAPTHAHTHTHTHTKQKQTKEGTAAHEFGQKGNHCILAFLFGIVQRSLQGAKNTHEQVLKQRKEENKCSKGRSKELISLSMFQCSPMPRNAQTPAPDTKWQGIRVRPAGGATAESTDKRGWKG